MKFYRFIAIVFALFLSQQAFARSEYFSFDDLYDGYEITSDQIHGQPLQMSPRIDLRDENELGKITKGRGSRNSRSEPIGNYNNGCILNAYALDLNSKYYQVYRPKQKRYFGDKSMIDFIEKFSKKIYKRRIGSVLVGDVSTQYGGRLNTGHASHQIGLDVDIEFNLDRINKNDLNRGGYARILVDKGEKHANSLFDDRYFALIMYAAAHPNVERIFVNPAIKVSICDEVMRRGKEHKFFPLVHKIRPWYGHKEHMHVRLKCPRNANDCERQDPIPHMTTIAQEKQDALSWYLPPPPGVEKAPKRPKPPIPARCERLVPQQYKSKSDTKMVVPSKPSKSGSVHRK